MHAGTILNILPRFLLNIDIKQKRLSVNAHPIACTVLTQIPFFEMQYFLVWRAKKAALFCFDGCDLVYIIILKAY